MGKITLPKRNNPTESERLIWRLALTYFAVASIILTCITIGAFFLMRQEHENTIVAAYNAHIEAAYERIDALRLKTNDFAKSLATLQWVKTLSTMGSYDMLNRRLDAVSRKACVQTLYGNKLLLDADALGVVFPNMDLAISSSYIHDLRDFFSGRIDFSTANTWISSSIRSDWRFSEPGILNLLGNRRRAIGYTVSIPVEYRTSHTTRLYVYFGVDKLINMLQIDPEDGTLVRITTNAGNVIYENHNDLPNTNMKWSSIGGFDHLRIDGIDASTKWRTEFFVPASLVSKTFYPKISIMASIFVSTLLVVGGLCYSLASVKLRPYQKIHKILRNSLQNKASSRNAQEYEIWLSKTVNDMVVEVETQKESLRSLQSQLRDYSLLLLIKGPSLVGNIEKMVSKEVVFPYPLVRCSIVQPSLDTFDLELLQDYFAQYDISDYLISIGSANVFILNYEMESVFEHFVAACADDDLFHDRHVLSIGPVVDKHHIHESYRAATQQLDSNSKDKVHIMYLRDHAVERQQIRDLAKVDEMVSYCFRTLNPEAVNDIIRTAFAVHGDSGDVSSRYAREMANAIYVFAEKASCEARGPTITGWVEPPAIDSDAPTLDVINATREYLLRSILSITNLPRRHNDLSLQIVKYIEKNLSNSELSLNLVAERFAISTVHLNKLLRRHQNTSFYECLSFSRMRCAKRLLSTTNLEIKSITARCGYESDTAFRRAFKSAVGVTPSQYRIANRISQAEMDSLPVVFDHTLSAQIPLE